MKTKKCELCGKEFLVTKPNRRFCSPKCQIKAWQKRTHYDRKKAIKLKAEDMVTRRHSTRGKKKWTNAEVKTLLKWKGNDVDLALKLGRTLSAIREKRYNIKNDNK